MHTKCDNFANFMLGRINRIALILRKSHHIGFSSHRDLIGKSGSFVLISCECMKTIQARIMRVFLQ